MDVTPDHLARRYFEECLGRGDFQALAEIMREPDFAEVSEAVRAMRVAFPDARVTINQLVSNGSSVGVHATVEATHLGDWRGISPTGKRVRYDAAGFFTVEDGRLVGVGGVTDALAIWCEVQPSRRAYLARWWGAMAWFLLVGLAVGTALSGGEHPFTR